MIEWVINNTLAASVIAVIAIAASRLLTRRPAVVHLLWVAVLVALVVPPLPKHKVLDAGRHIRDAGSAIGGMAAASIGLRQERATPVRRVVSPPDPDKWKRVEDPQLKKPKVEESSAEHAEPAIAQAWQPASAQPEYPARSGTAPTRAEDAALRADDPATVYSSAPPGTGRAARKSASPYESAAAAPGSKPEARPPASGPARAAWLVSAGDVVLAAWWFGAGLVAAGAWRRLATMRREIRCADARDERVEEEVRRIAAALGVRPPRVRVSRRAASPFVVGVLRPTLVWPASVEVESAGSQGVLVHELAHLARRDHWVAAFEMLVLCALWWHPLAWVARRQLRRHAELACDAWVVWALPTTRRQYADALLEIVERLAGGVTPAPALGAADSDRRSLTRRLTMIMTGNVARRGSRGLAVALLGACALFAPAWAGSTTLASMVSSAGDVSRAMQKAADRAHLRWAAERYETGQDSERALEAYGQLLKANDEDKDLWSSYAMLAYDAERYDDAAKAFKHLSELEDGDADQAYNQACCLALAGNERAALKALGRAVARGYSDAEHARDDSDLSTIHDSDEFEELAERMETLEAAMGEAEDAKHDDNWDAAIAALNKAEEMAPECGEVRYAIAFAAYYAGDCAAAADAFRAQAKLGHRPAVAWYNAACAESLAGDVGAALDMLDKSVAAGFDDHKLMRKDTDLDTVRDEAAFASLLERVTAPARLYAEMELAKEFEDWGAIAERARKLLAMTEDEHEQAKLQSYVGLALLYSGEYEEAEEAFAESATLGTDAGSCLYNIACARSMGGDANGALDYLEAAVHAGYSDAEHMRQDADLSGVHGSPSFEKIARKAEDVQALETLGATDWGYLFDRSTARLAEDEDDGRAWMGLGWAHLRLGRTGEALKAFERQAESGFAEQIAHYNVACCYAIMGDKKAAFDALNRSIDEGFDAFELMANDRDLENLRGDARFEALLKAAPRHDEDEQVSANMDEVEWTDAADKDRAKDNDKARNKGKGAI